MSTTCRIDKDEGIVYVQNRGRVNLHSFVQSVIDVTGTPDFSPKYKVLSDLRDIQYVPAVSDAVDFGDFLAALSTLLREKVAAVLSDPVLYRLSKVVCLIARARGIRMRSFDDMDAARLWLLEGADGEEELGLTAEET